MIHGRRKTEAGSPTTRDSMVCPPAGRFRDECSQDHRCHPPFKERVEEPGRKRRAPLIHTGGSCGPAYFARTDREMQMESALHDLERISYDINRRRVVRAEN
jgi:hypothetical protein